ncbi:MAG: hypothetical protein QXF46_01960 [Thermofilaceae archaeon]
MRVTSIIAIVLLTICLALYWIPIPLISMGESNLILGGYPWQAPTPQARSFFITLGLVLTAVAVVLAVLAYVFGRDVENGDAEETEMLD